MEEVGKGMVTDCELQLGWGFLGLLLEVLWPGLSVLPRMPGSAMTFHDLRLLGQGFALDKRMKLPPCFGLSAFLLFPILGVS